MESFRNLSLIFEFSGNDFFNLITKTWVWRRSISILSRITATPSTWTLVNWEEYPKNPSWAHENHVSSRRVNRVHDKLNLITQNSSLWTLSIKFQEALCSKSFHKTKKSRCSRFVLVHSASQDVKPCFSPTRLAWQASHWSCASFYLGSH